jgi:hypothetical protein
MSSPVYRNPLNKGFDDHCGSLGFSLQQKVRACDFFDTRLRSYAANFLKGPQANQPILFGSQIENRRLNLGEFRARIACEDATQAARQHLGFDATNSQSNLRHQLR